MSTRLGGFLCAMGLLGCGGGDPYAKVCEKFTNMARGCKMTVHLARGEVDGSSDDKARGEARTRAFFEVDPTQWPDLSRNKVPEAERPALKTAADQFGKELEQCAAKTDTGDCGGGQACFNQLFDRMLTTANELQDKYEKKK